MNKNMNTLSKIANIRVRYLFVSANGNKSNLAVNFKPQLVQMVNSDTGMSELLPVVLPDLDTLLFDTLYGDILNQPEKIEDDNIYPFMKSSEGQAIFDRVTGIIVNVTGVTKSSHNFKHVLDATKNRQAQIKTLSAVISKEIIESAEKGYIR
jgi:hypothetical protein|nr:MAG TPA: hypothetical protein [Caudoviricetes sp.]